MCIYLSGVMGYPQFVGSHVLFMAPLLLLTLAGQTFFVTLTHVLHKFLGKAFSVKAPPIFSRVIGMSKRKTAAQTSVHKG